MNVPDSLDPNMQESQQIFSFDNRLNNNIEEEAVMFDKLKEDIKEEEDIAMKSALLLQLLEVGLLHKMIQFTTQNLNTTTSFLSIEECEFSVILFSSIFQKSTMGSTLPLIYVENQPTEAIDNDSLYPTEKRSGRYYRRYPWKRQNNKHRA